MERLYAKLRIVPQFLSEGAKVHLWASPNFLLEFILAITLGFIYVYLCYEVNKIYKQTVRLRPHTIHFRKSIKGSCSKDSICTSITRIQHEYCKFDVYKGGNGYSVKRTKRTASNTSHMEWLLAQQPGDFFRPMFEDKNKLLVDKLAALTPAQFVKLDKERQMRDRQIKGCMHSLTTLFDNIIAKKFTETRLKEQIETAKEETICSRVSDQVMKYLDSESVTESLINVLNDIVEDTSLDSNHLPSELTTLVYDIGNLKDKSSMIFDTKCDLVPSSTSLSSGTNKTDTSDQEVTM